MLSSNKTPKTSGIIKEILIHETLPSLHFMLVALLVGASNGGLTIGSKLPTFPLLGGGGKDTQKYNIDLNQPRLTNF